MPASVVYCWLVGLQGCWLAEYGGVGLMLPAIVLWLLPHYVDAGYVIGTWSLLLDAGRTGNRVGRALLFYQLSRITERVLAAKRIWSTWQRKIIGLN